MFAGLNGVLAITTMVVGLMLGLWIQSDRVASAKAEVVAIKAQRDAQNALSDALVEKARSDVEERERLGKEVYQAIIKDGKINEKRRDAELAAANERLRQYQTRRRAMPITSSTTEVRDGTDPLEFLIPHLERDAKLASEADRVADRLRCAQEVIIAYRSIVNEGRYRMADCGPDGDQN